MPSHPPTHTHMLAGSLLLCAMLPLLIACGAAAPAAPATVPPAASPTAALPTAPPTATPATVPATEPPTVPTTAPPTVPTTAPPTAIPATASPSGTPALARVITNADGGGQFTFAVGQTFSLQLSARRWSQPVVDPQILRALPVPTPAAPAASRWDYQAVAPGRTDLTTEGACPPAPPGGVTCMSIELYKITIIVTP